MKGKTLNIHTAVPAADVNFAGGWNTLWGAITSGFPQLVQIITVVGVILVLGTLLKWAWDRRRGGGMAQGAQPVWGTLIIGSILMAPTIVMPLLLLIVDGIANAGLALFKAATGG